MTNTESFIYFEPIIHCRKCGLHILLPLSCLPEDQWSLIEDTDQQYWPSDEWKAVFGCASCGYVFEYTAQDVDWNPVPKSAQGTYYSGANLFCAEFQCARKGCKTPIKLHVEKASAYESEITQLLRESFFFGDLPCGHGICPLPGGEYRIHRIMTI